MHIDKRSAKSFPRKTIIFPGLTLKKVNVVMDDKQNPRLLGDDFALATF